MYYNKLLDDSLPMPMHLEFKLNEDSQIKNHIDPELEFLEKENAKLTKEMQRQLYYTRPLNSLNFRKINEKSVFLIRRYENNNNNSRKKQERYLYRLWKHKENQYKYYNREKCNEYYRKNQRIHLLKKKELIEKDLLNSDCQMSKTE